MSTNADHTPNNYEAVTSSTNQGTTNGGTTSHDFEHATRGMSHEEKATAAQAARFGYGPLAHFNTKDSAGVLPGEYRPFDEFNSKH